MSSRLSALLAICWFAAACGGGTGGTTTTTGTSTGGTTTGGTTTGGTAKYQDGQDCGANTDCLSGVCGLNGTGKCCAASCGDAGGACDATGCDETGACAFPTSGTQCQPDACATGSVTSYQCDGKGSCQAQQSAACPGDSGCSSDGTTCALSCTSSAECASGFVCNGGTCVVQKTIGPCTENDDCFSMRCGANGKGNCCTGTVVCATSDATCGATDCDPDRGACQYADAGTACGSVLASCSNGTEQGPSACDGNGICNTPSPAACTPFICGSNACLATCSDGSSCGVGDYCDTNHGSCCTPLASGSTITVDATAGSDATACCSVPGYLPCQTLTEAMKQIDVAQAQNVTVSAVVRTGRTWAPPGEVYPIVLGWGVELSAPNVFFFDGADGGISPAIFEIQAVSGKDKVGYASIVGAAKKPVTIGDDELRDQSMDDTIIRISAGNTLYLANAQLDSSEEVDNNAITIAAGGNLVVAQDQSAAVTGTVTIGYSDLGNRGDWGYGGIVCESSKTAGCTISDALLDGGASSLVIQGQAGVDIDAEDFAKVTLTGAPQIGIPAGSVGFNVCDDKVDGEDGFGLALTTAAIMLNGSASMDFENGTIQCISADGIDLQATSIGTPTLTLVNSTIENTNTGLNVFAGSATVSGSTIQFNGNGVAQTTDGTNNGTVDLNGGDAGNTIICSDSSELNGEFVNFEVGVCVSNSTSNSLDADNVTWDTPGPDLFACDSALETCICQLPSCTIDTADGGVDGMDAVEIGDAGAITTTGNQLSTVACDYPPPIGGDCDPTNPNSCGAGLICCPFFIPVECVPQILCGP